MELNKCPNCSGKLTLAKDRKAIVCTYCGSEFSVDEDTKKQMKKQPVNMDWFIYDWDYKKIKATDVCKTVVETFIRTLNEYETSARIEAYMREYLMGFDDVSANGIREEKMRDIVKRISPRFEPGEHVIFYYDDGILSLGKTGVVITDKRTFFVERRNIKEVMHVSIPFITISASLGYPCVHLGDKHGNDIGGYSGYASHLDLEGAAMALICAFAFEQRPDRPKIRLVDDL